MPVKEQLLYYFVTSVLWKHSTGIFVFLPYGIFITELCVLDRDFYFLQGRSGDVSHFNDLWSVVEIKFPGAGNSKRINRGCKVNYRSERIYSLLELDPAIQCRIAAIFAWISSPLLCPFCSTICIAVMPAIQTSTLFAELMAAQRPTGNACLSETILLESTEIC